ncbi:MAG: diadenylate cyclase CdaA [Flavobacteriales bacterium]|nr:diadenylate cyclase CdaA [Flavobacteriales bacterium]
MLQFIQFDFLDLLDVVLVAVLIYQVYQIIRGTIAIRIFLGIFTIYLFWKIVEALNMELLSEILGQFIGVGVILLIIVFQEELRKFLLLVGNTEFLSSRMLSGNMFHFGAKEKSTLSLNIKDIARACANMSRSKTGAIIVISKTSELDFYLGSGEILNARISQSLIENIFFKNSPMHDGAVLIKDNTILAARCVLPVSENKDLPPTMGMRHRAALGITEKTSAIALIVSEETGKISTVQAGKFKLNITPENLEFHLNKILQET